MNSFEAAYIEVLTDHYRMFPKSYVKSLDRTIETEIEMLKSGLSRKDSDVMLKTCEFLGIKNSYHEIFRMMESSL